MKLLFHIVANDLRRLRFWLMAWVVVLALPILEGVRTLRVDPLDDATWNLQDEMAWATMLEIGVAYLLMLLLVQGDAVVGTRQFWLTRPISGQRLLAAKTVGAAVVLWIIPLLVSLPW